MSGPNPELRKVREETVQRHIDTELAGDVDGAIGTFAPGRVSYDVPAIGRLMLTEDEVREYLTDFVETTRDRHMAVIHLHHSDDAVIAEVELDIVELDQRNRDSTSGVRTKSRHCVIFRFDGDQLWQEASYGGAVTD